MSSAADEVVPLGPRDQQELLGRLQEKCLATEKELNAMPAAPKAAKDIFQLCRGFERAFSTTIDSVDYSALIRGTFTGDNGLKGTVNRLPIERQFKLDNVKAVCRQADGFQKSLVSPEFGLKRLVSEAVETVADPVTSAVYKIHLVLIDAAREAARKASAFADVKAVNETRTPLQLPGFEKQVVFAAQQALEAWREEALTVAKTLVTMEQSYVTAAFFRHRTRERWNQIKIQQMEQELVEGGGNQVGSEDDSGDEESNVRRSLDSSPPINRNELATYSTTSSVGGPLAGGLTIPQQAQNPDDPGDLKTGYLEKRVGEHSGRQSVPGESFKWQKRYFVLTEPKGMLYYFKSADDPPNYRGVINLKECRVEDVDVDGIARSTSSKAGDQSAVSLLIKIGHKDPTRPIVKNHHSVVLRAESAAEKYSWLSRLKNASSTGGARTPPTKMDSSQKMAQSQRDQQTADYKPEQRKSPDPNSQRYSQPKTPHPVQNSGFGGTVLFHENSNIGPEPLMNSSAVSAQAQDEFLRQLAEDTAAYVRTVCNTLVLTVPKAIVHCQVKRAQNHLLEALYAHISSLKQFETDTMLEENPEVVQRRAATKKALGDLEDAVAEVKSLMERAGENDKEVNFPIGLVKLSGLRKLIPSSGREREREAPVYGEYTPGGEVRRSTSGGRRGYADASTPKASQGAPPVRTISGSSTTSTRGERPPSGRTDGRRTTGGAPPPQQAPPQPQAPAQGAPAGSPGVVPRRRPPPAPPGSLT